MSTHCDRNNNIVVAIEYCNGVIQYLARSQHRLGFSFSFFVFRVTSCIFRLSPVDNRLRLPYIYACARVHVRIVFKLSSRRTARPLAPLCSQRLSLLGRCPAVVSLAGRSAALTPDAGHCSSWPGPGAASCCRKLSPRQRRQWHESASIQMAPI